MIKELSRGQRRLKTVRDQNLNVTFYYRGYVLSAEVEGGHTERTRQGWTWSPKAEM